MAQQTAVEWIAEKMKKLTPPGYQTEISAMLRKAKQMEKEQIMKAHNDGFLVYGSEYRTAEQYYNGTYGKSNGS